jgi:hypothetical protein
MEKIRIRDKHPGSGIIIPDPQHCPGQQLEPHRMSVPEHGPDVGK